MKTRLNLDDGSAVGIRQPKAGEPDVACKEAACPGCGNKPMRVQGCGAAIEDHDTYQARAKCTCCGAAVGTLRVTVGTIFGLEEDERVLNGRARVY